MSTDDRMMSRAVAKVAGERTAVPFVWLPDGLQEGPLQEVVGQSVGAASRCWHGGTGSLEFDSTTASAVVDGLMAYLSDWADVVRKQANESTVEKMRSEELNKPLLGLATTRELIEELLARSIGMYNEDGNAMHAVAGALLRSLTPEGLAYRTVGREKVS